MAESKELARRMMELTDRHDWAGREALMTQDCEFVTPNGATTGPAAATAYSAPFTVAFSGDRHQIEVLASAGDLVVAEGHWGATHTGPLATPDGDIPATGKSVRLPFVVVMRTAGERVASVHVYYDQLAFMAQLGLVPQPQAA
jgi:predicted ester cyclase